MDTKDSKLNRLIEKLKSNREVVGLFFAGSTAQGSTKHSDIDLVVILRSNPKKIRSVYTLIEDRIADIFFFDIKTLQRLLQSKRVDGNAMEGMLYTWIRKGKVIFDTSGLLKRLHRKSITLIVRDSEKNTFWVKTNYMLLENEHYFRSGKREYYQALHLQLAYSVMDLVTAFCAFRNIPWRGEKETLVLLGKKHRKYYKTLQSFFRQTSLKRRMMYYRSLVNLTMTRQHPLWGDSFIVGLLEPFKYDSALTRWWKSFVRDK